ncbi:MAG: Arabinose 5-phosphate isomerase KdsD [Alphaproteobacteria bacterium MarineAlpha5_Bin6]|nr:MAG: Arabinose 5-phosphate isomerase KdsD [Alphaproteobacteria bacterium MarineAlpha5_Bin7]PPR54993.1 MAG: Arabinose 5-phosphate isomerase KdsD [Alphaproteobacteria bacterium MarineAlpha5_Bin6]|tara:strand:- start:3775 stop:4731 length:957 start_codon:yes stop_codon:yes gene_type:complete
MKKSEIIKEAKRVLKIEIDSAKTLSSTFNNAFYNVVKTIYNTKGRLIITGIGKSGHIANKISATLSSTGTPSQFVHPTEASHGDLGNITKNDCILAISNSGQSNELNNLINFAKRFNIPLLSISSNKKGILFKKSDHAILFKKPMEACSLNLAPTSSTTMSLIIGDAIAVSLLKMRGFKKSNFSKFHPGGNLGKDLVKLSDIMHGPKELPLVKDNELMSKTLLVMTKKSFGCVGVINKSKKIVGIITDGDLRRNMKTNIVNMKASQVMTKKPTLATSNMLVGEALNIMNSKKITSLFVCINSQPIGIIHIHDLLRLST